MIDNLCPDCQQPTNATPAQIKRHFYYCRNCATERRRRWRAANLEADKARYQAWRAANIDADRERIRRYGAAHPERGRQFRASPAGREYMRAYRARPEQRIKNRARNTAMRAMRAGRLMRQPCELCGAAKVEMHHESYDQPLVVRWLCRPCHGRAHRAGAES